MRWLILAALVGLAVAYSNRDSNPYRLPDNAVPSEYELELAPYFESERFDGRVQIKFTVKKSTDEIKLHYRELEIIVVVLFAVNGNNIPVDIYKNRTYDAVHEIMTVNTQESLVPGVTYEIEIEYLGKAHANSGFMIREYETEDGEIRKIAATQLEPTHARMIMPCFDEPSLKAKFTVKISRKRDQTALSNMALDGESKPDDKRPNQNRMLDIFKPTPLMSTYLLAIAISDFKSTNGQSNPIYKVHAPEHRLNQTYFSRDIGPRILHALEQYTATKYPLEKMDSFPFPEYGGAMENWGLILYSTNLLLELSEEFHGQMAEVQAHELAHQWFGNIVTCEWWNNIWLNEGFANYFQYYILNEVDSSLRSMDEIIRQSVIESQMQDAAVGSFALNHDVNTNAEIQAKFDTISYKKGGSILWMISNAVGEAVFKAGLRVYLRNNAYRNVNPEHLLLAIDSVRTDIGPNGSIPMTRAMKPWIENSGFPVITITRDYENMSLNISQYSIQTGSTRKTWWIPLTWTSETEPNFERTSPQAWLPPYSTEAYIEALANANQWVLFNVRKTGYYKVNYDPINWKLLANALKDTNNGNIHWINRMALLDDAFVLALIGKTSYSTALDLTLYLPNEAHPEVKIVADQALKLVDSYLAGTNLESSFRRFLNDIKPKSSGRCASRSSPRYHKAQDELSLRNCRDGHCEAKGCAEDSSAIMCRRAKEGTLLEEELLNARTASQRRNILAAIPCNPNPIAIGRVISEIMANKAFTEEEISTIWENFIQAHPRKVINELFAQWPVVLERLQNYGTYEIMRALSLTPLTTEELTLVSTMEKMRFENKQPYSKIVPAPKSIVIEINEWRKRYYDEVDRWLQAYMSGFPTSTTSDGSSSGTGPTVKPTDKPNSAFSFHSIKYFALFLPLLLAAVQL